MLQLGKWNTLRVLRESPQGLYLGDGDADVLLPNKYVPENTAVRRRVKRFYLQRFRPEAYSNYL